MKQRKIKDLQLSKTTIAKINVARKIMVKGGTEPVSRKLTMQGMTTVGNSLDCAVGGNTSG